jgi:hypothetical protein
LTKKYTKHHNFDSSVTPADEADFRFSNLLRHELFIVIFAKNQEDIWPTRAFRSFRDKPPKGAGIYG